MDAILKKDLRHLEKYFKQKDVVEICINEPGTVWLETFDGWIKKQDKALTLKTLTQMMTNLATVRGQKFDDYHPTLATSIPEYGYRVQAVGNSLAERGISISIRIAQARRFPIESYMSAADAKELIEAIRVGKSILVAGGTSSGKTTFLNSAIQEIPETTRVLVIEDTKELVIDQPNSPRWIRSKTGTDLGRTTWKDVINTAMRFRPDRILMGELDIENTVPFLRMLNAGHAGSMATVHANGTMEAIDAIVQNAQLDRENGLGGGPELVTRYATKSLDIVVYIERLDRRNFKAQAEWIKG